MKEIRVGVLGCAGILERSLIHPLSRVEGMRLAGISSRTLSKAQQYASDYGIPVVFPSYEAMLKSSEIDLVYIVLSNDLHKDWILRAAEANKHVLVEKPLCLNSSECSEIEQVRQSVDVHILEGLMVQHHPWLAAIKSFVDDKPFGQLRQIDSKICIVPKYDLQQNYRSRPEKGGGSFYDLSCYWLQLLQKTVGLAAVDCSGRSAFDGPNGCDLTFEARMDYGNGVSAALVTSFERPYKAEHKLHFEHATVTVQDFFRACLGDYKITVKIENHAASDIQKVVFEPQNYYVNQLLYVRDVIHGKAESLPVSEATERIRLAEIIYQSAKERRNRSHADY